MRRRRFFRELPDQPQSVTSPDHQQAQCDSSKKSPEWQACILTERRSTLFTKDERISPFEPICPEGEGRGSVLTIDTIEGFCLNAGVARQLRIQYEGAIYHLMTRGDRREEIFRDDVDRKRFRST